MGVDVAQWRARIGCYSCNKSKRIQKKNTLGKVCLIASVLLFLCGDVELNPGPKTDFPIQGTFHQGDELFSFESRGRQCLPCCTVFLIKLYMKPFISSQWVAKDLDEILIQGDYVYKFARETLMSYRSFLEPQDVPPFIQIDKIYFNWKIKKTYSGTINENFSGNYPFVNLKLALAMGLSGNVNENHFCIFLCKESAIAISSQNGFFVVFDSQVYPHPTEQVLLFKRKPYRNYVFI